MSGLSESSYYLSIEGMSCPRCVAAVEDVISGLSGVQHVQVDLESATAEITGGQVQAVIAAINTAGYQAFVQSARRPLGSRIRLASDKQSTQRDSKVFKADYQLAVEDMTCASCVAAVERAIRAVPGVEEVAVNLLEKRAQVVGGEPERVTHAINDQGYRAYHIEQRHKQDDVALVFQQQTLTKAEQSNILQDLLLTWDSQARYYDSQSHWRISTKQHPADLLVALEQIGHEARIMESITDPYAQEIDDAAQEVKRSWLRALLAGGVGFGLMAAEMTGSTPPIHSLDGERYGLVVAIVCLFVMRFSGGHYYLGALKQLKHRAANMDTLIALGTGTAWFASLVIILQPDDNIFLRGDKLYFDASVMILAFLQFGHALEIRAKRITSESVGALVGLVPKVAHVVRGQGCFSIPVSLLRIGDLIQALPGERIAVDGQVVDGQSHVDEAMLTGESLPVHKQIGDGLFAGSVNRNGRLIYQVTRLGEETTLAHIIAMVRQAQMSKPAIGRLVDKVSAIFVPVVVTIALITFIAWLMVGSEPTLSYALSASIAVLVIACPCALGLATPIAIMVGTSRAAQMQVLIRNSDGLQSASELTHLVVDKTGTLTQGAPSVSALYCEEISEDELLGLAASVEVASTHPLASAVVEHAENAGIKRVPVTAFQSHDGLGVEGVVAGRHVRLGGARYLMRQGIAPSGKWWQQAQNEAEQGGSLVWVLVDGELMGFMVLKDPIRYDSYAAVKMLQEQGIEVVVCTGDHTRTAQAVARHLSIEKVYSEQMPEEKLALVKTLQQRGHRVGMVGDGVNDAPALAQADTSFALGSGTDVAIEHADITLVGDSLRQVSTAIGISRATLRNIKQNLFGAFIYNMIGIPLAAGLFYPLTGWLLPPMFASAAMAMSSVTVVANANRLRFFRPQEEMILTTTLKVAGMTCSHCVHHVTKALMRVPGVEKAEVTLDDGTAVVIGTIDPSSLLGAITEAGYSAQVIT
jgi:Cu+-exporting ATPase